MSKFTVAPSVLAYTQFPAAAALATAVQNVVLNYTDASWSAPLSTILPTVMSRQLAGASSVSDNSSGLLSLSDYAFCDANAADASGVVGGPNGVNPKTYILMAGGLGRLKDFLRGGSSPIASGSRASARVLLTDCNGSVVYDSAKTNTNTGAYCKIYSSGATTSTPAPINENHFTRIEFVEAQRSDSGIGINTRFSGTLKSIEDRVVFALKAPGTTNYSNSTIALLSISCSHA